MFAENYVIANNVELKPALFSTSTVPTTDMLFLFQVSLVAKLEIRDDSGKDMVCFLWPAQIVD